MKHKITGSVQYTSSSVVYPTRPSKKDKMTLHNVTKLFFHDLVMRITEVSPVPRGDHIRTVSRK